MRSIHPFPHRICLPIPTFDPDPVGIGISFVVANPVVMDKHGKTSGEPMRLVGKGEVPGFIFSIALSIGEIASRP
jgi:hypothetical protein